MWSTGLCQGMVTNRLGCPVPQSLGTGIDTNQDGHSDKLAVTNSI